MINVLFFGRMADISGTRGQQVGWPQEGLTLLVLRDRLLGEAVQAGRVRTADIRMSVNRNVIADDQPLRDGDEVAFFSVFSGG